MAGLSRGFGVWSGYGGRARPGKGRRGAATLCLSGVLALALSLAAPAGPARAETQDLLAFGDSLTQGYGLAQGAGLVPQLEEWLRAQGRDVRVINGGVSGDTTAGGRARIGWSLGEDVDAVMVILGGNDLLRGLDPARTRANLDAILDEIDAAGLPALLVGMQAPGNFGQDYKAAFDGLYPDLAEAHGALFEPSFLSPLMGDPDAPDPSAARRFLQGDGIHPNAEGVARIVEALGPRVLDLLERAEAG